MTQALRRVLQTVTATRPSDRTRMLQAVVGTADWPVAVAVLLPKLPA